MCCIDKTSSTEENYSINSIFQWHENSSLCIIHLSSSNGRLWQVPQVPCRWLSND
ncbi:hypothetical protein F4809DRAFT_586419 [Biscogniauxia mediterranea]|nr:hypothetical protein F4809DRAFT_586419 [Biscogniauxia mediterranea]